VYREILRTPGILPVLLSSVVARLPVGALGLIYVLRTREMTGSYAAGGIVAAAQAVAYGIGSPVLGRMVDRRGQTPVIPVCAVVSGLALAGFAALPDGAPLGLAIALAAVGGASVAPLTACQRAIWNERLAPSTRQAAYALDSVVFEFVYIAGPLLLVTAVGAWSLQAAAATAAALNLGGSFAFAATRLSREWRPHAERSDDRMGALRGAGVRTILLMLGMFAVAVAVIEIGVAAFTQREGHASAVGVMLGLWGVGSMIGGLVAGHLRPQGEPVRRLLWLMGGLAAATMPIALADDLWAMGAAMVVAGLFIAPALALAFSILSDIAPTGTVTEAHTLVGTGFGIGIAGGSALGGWIVEGGTTTAAFATAAVAMVLAAGVATRLRPSPPQRPPAPVPAPARPGSR
jgi:predicted MFS family arabinose efflux permease